MAKERLKSPRLRLFIALEPPAAARELLVRWQSDLVAAGGGELRASTPSSLHVTLAFVGYRPEGDVERLTAALQSVTPEPVPLHFPAEPTAKPPRRPRLYAAALAPEPALMAVRARLVDALTHEAGFADEQREFWPHVTLCRVKSSVKRHLPIDDPPRAPDELTATAHFAHALTLYSSDLQPSGAVYTPLASVALPAAPV